MLRSVDPEMPERALHDRLTAALAERLARAPNGLIDTYPGGTWPPDVAAVAGSIGLHAAVTGIDRRALLERWAGRFTACAVSSSGYLVQRVQSGTCRPLDAPRGSGTAIASYMLGFADAPLSQRLYEAVRTQGRITRLGFVASASTPPATTERGTSTPVRSSSAPRSARPATRSARPAPTATATSSASSTEAPPSDGPECSSENISSFRAAPELANALLLAMLTANRL